MGNNSSTEGGESLMGKFMRRALGDWEEDLWPQGHEGTTHHWCLCRDPSAKKDLHFCHDAMPDAPEHDPEFDYGLFKCGSADCQTCLDLDRELYPSRDLWRGVVNLERDPKSRDIHFTWGVLNQTKDGGCKVCGILVEGIQNIKDEALHLTDTSVFRLELLEGFTVRVTLERPPAPLAGVEMEIIYKFSVEFHATVYASQEKSVPWQAFGPAQVLERDIEVSNCVAFVQDRVKECPNHSKCLSQDPSILSTRLLDVGSGENDVRLEISPKDGELYTTLSHVWGSLDIPMTTRANFEQHCKNIPWSTLTRTFQDAISVTRGLGVRYLWIDSLCIIQDNADDWIAEAGKMAQVYMGSYLTLAATSAYDTSGGLLRPRRTLNERKEEVDVQEHEIARASSNGKTYSIFARRTLKRSHYHLLKFDHDILHSSRAPLLKRAWVLQERLLSARTLHFCFDEMVWECNTGITCECGYGSSASGKAESDSRVGRNVFRDLFNRIQLPEHQKSDVDDVSNDEDDLLRAWYRLLEYYVTLGITYPEDRLPALGGLTKNLQDKMGWEYVKGVWMHDFVRGALFLVMTSATSFRREDAPTWSWASIESRSESIPDSNLNFLVAKQESWNVDTHFRVVEYSAGQSQDRAQLVNSNEEGNETFVVVEAVFVHASVVVSEIVEDPEPKETKEDVATPNSTEVPGLSAEKIQDPNLAQPEANVIELEAPKASDGLPSDLESSIAELDVTERPPLPQAINTEPNKTDVEPESKENTEPEGPKFATKLLYNGSTDTIQVKWDIGDTYTLASETAEVLEGHEVHLILLAHYITNFDDIMKCHGLVLKGDHNSCYRRVGMFSAPDDMVFSEKKKMRIV